MIYKIDVEDLESINHLILTRVFSSRIFRA
ncbi:hypothetical protein C8N40_10598 [Pontibacter mucosus]|uniref:Uncharacterized protein n=1 Tax=Pontibacter mucosus TaxID=1649266 RepID=A0A2T5YHL1_9BACT|nr:hypothetical protein C8N40_10598 [Pontibacter mucosus]